MIESVQASPFGVIARSNRATALHATHGDHPEKEPMHIENWIRRRVHYGWIVAVTFVTILAAAGIRSNHLYHEA